MATRSLPLTEGKPRSEKNKKEPLVFAIIVYLFLSAFPVYLPVRARATSYGVECRCRPEAELSLGMENEDVLELQKFLKSKGFYSPTPSGLYDQKTARAVQSFQTAHGLPVNGKVDGSTWSAIGRISLGEPVATSPARRVSDHRGYQGPDPYCSGGQTTF